jgi:hypothetical protein
MSVRVWRRLRLILGGAYRCKGRADFGVKSPSRRPSGTKCLNSLESIKQAELSEKSVQRQAGSEEVPKSQVEMLRELGALIEEYPAFRRSRPDLPQGDLWELSQDELEQIVAAFQEHIALAKERPSRLY